jgi:hypothetical protein
LIQENGALSAAKDLELCLFKANSDPPFVPDHTQWAQIARWVAWIRAKYLLKMRICTYEVTDIFRGSMLKRLHHNQLSLHTSDMDAAFSARRCEVRLNLICQTQYKADPLLHGARGFEVSARFPRMLYLSQLV